MRYSFRLLGVVLGLSVLGMLCDCKAQTKDPSSKAVVFYVQPGTLDKLTDSEAVLKISVAVASAVHPDTVSFQINKTAIIDKVQRGNRVSAVYTKQEARRILVSLQRLPDFDLGAPPGDEHLGTAMLVPGDQGRLLIHTVKNIEAGSGNPAWNDTARILAFSGKLHEKGVVSGVSWVDPTTYKLFLDPATSSQAGSPQEVFVNALTRVDGDVKKGSPIQILYKELDGHKIATLVKVADTDAGGS
jgi:hypothetical protein